MEELGGWFVVVKYNSEIVALVERLEDVVNEAKKRWYGTVKPANSLALLNTVSTDLLLLKRFLSEDNMEAAKLSWTISSLKESVFSKAFYCQKPIHGEATELRLSILDAMKDAMHEKTKRVKIEDLDTIIDA